MTRAEPWYCATPDTPEIRGGGPRSPDGTGGGPGDAVRCRSDCLHHAATNQSPERAAASEKETLRTTPTRLRLVDGESKACYRTMCGGSFRPVGATVRTIGKSLPQSPTARAETALLADATQLRPVDTQIRAPITHTLCRVNRLDELFLAEVVVRHVSGFAAVRCGRGLGHF